MTRQGTIAVPIRTGPKGYFATTSSEEQEIRDSIRQIVFVNPGERFMRNDLGVPLFSFVFDPIVEIFDAAIENYIRAQVNKWEPRVNVTGVSAERDDHEDGSVGVLIRVDYLILATDATSNTTINRTFIRTP